MPPVLEAIDVKARGLTFPALACGDGPLVLCLHGFPDCLRSFRFQLPALAAAGFRAVAPALRGYAAGCQSDLRETHVLAAADDALALLDTLGAEQAHLIGHDWGAVAAYLAAARAPRRFKSVITMAVPHPLGIAASLYRVPSQLRASWYIFFFQLRGTAERALRARDFALIERLWRDWSPGFRPEDADLAALKNTFAVPGVVEGALAYYRALFQVTSASARETRALLAQPISTPLLALTGADDGCVRSELYDFAMGSRWFTDATVERLQGVGHFLHQEDPARVNARILAFCRAHP
jgi:pimeloyl-ACP methyl ester carboxylesterase